MTEHEEKMALLLDDHSDTDIDAAIDAATRDVNLQYRMRRYRMIGETLRRELPPAVDLDFHNQVMSRIRTETLIMKAAASSRARVNRPSRRGWMLLRPLAGAAVALSVAVVTVALWQQRPGGNIDDQQLVDADEEKIIELARQPVPSGALQAGMRWKVERDTPQIQQKLNAYLVNHTEYSNSVQGLIPQARVAGFDAQK